MIKYTGQFKIEIEGKEILKAALNIYRERLDELTREVKRLKADIKNGPIHAKKYTNKIEKYRIMQSLPPCKEKIEIHSQLFMVQHRGAWPVESYVSSNGKIYNRFKSIDSLTTQELEKVCSALSFNNFYVSRWKAFVAKHMDRHINGMKLLPKRETELELCKKATELYNLLFEDNDATKT
jgi:hypothetical protein